MAFFMNHSGQVETCLVAPLPPAACWYAPYDDELGVNDYSTLVAGNEYTTFDSEYVGAYTIGAWESSSNIVAVDTVTIPCDLEGCEAPLYGMSIRVYNPTASNIPVRVYPHEGGENHSQTEYFVSGESSQNYSLDASVPWSSGAIIEIEKSGVKLLSISFSCGVG